MRMKPQGRAVFRGGPLDGKDCVVPELLPTLKFDLLQPIKAEEREEYPSRSILLDSAEYRLWKHMSNGAIYDYVTPLGTT